MYADFTYYQTEYGGKLVESADFLRLSRKSARLMDGITGNKLQFAFPVNDRDAVTVKDCQCELIDFLQQVEQYQNSVIQSVGIVAQADGTVKGKVITSISSGSESRSYSIGSSASTTVAEAAKDKKVMDMLVYEIIRDNLAGVPDANGVNLLYAGKYPERRSLWE